MGMSTALRNATLDSGYDAVFNSGSLEFRTAAAADADTAPAGSLLASVSTPADAFANAAAGVKSKAGTWSVAASAGGTIVSARLKQTADLGTTNTTDERHDFTVGVQGATVAITAASIVGGMAQFTCTAHGYSNGDMVEIAGHNVAYNRKWIVYNVTANTFQVASSAATNGANGTSRKSFEICVDNTSINSGQTITVNSLDIVL
jgi:hypothetical protein